MSDFSPPQLERQLGMHAYLTASEGTGGTIKNEIEDFIVSEIPLLPAANERGNFVICRVTARNWETNRLVRELSRRLQIGRKRIGFAGTKDKRGLTSRYMSFEGVDEGVLRSIDIRDVDVEVVGRANRRLNLGDLWGNSFSITIRDCSYSGNRLAEVASAVISELKQTKGFPNFYGVQRFGSIRPNTHIVGRYIVKKDFRGAVHAYAGNPSGKENDEVRQARTLFDEGADADEVFSSMPDVMVFERILLSHLSEHPDDYAGALRRLPSNLLMMFVHALQASLFNEMISARIAEDLPLHLAVEGDIVLPINEHHLPDRGRLVSVSATNISAVNRQMSAGNGFVSALLFGHSSVFAGGKQGEIERQIVQSNGLEERDFVVPEISECTSAGSRREVLSPLHSIYFRADGDSLHLKFDLVRGSYATSLLREIMKC